ncbi:MAG: hypothetical protein NXI14_13490 [bacterium]|nr:hypothetical protein [bacterium]
MFFGNPKSRVLFSSLLLAPVLTLGACESETEETRGESSTIPDNTSVIDEYQMAMRSQIAQLNRQIALLDERAEDLGEDARERYNQSIEAIKQQRNEFEVALTNLQAETGAAWAEVKVGLERSWNDITTAVDETRQEFFNGEGDDDNAPTG